MDSEQTAANLLVARAFESLGIPYFLGGSMASSVHGIYRATADADFVAAIRPQHVEPLARLLKPAFYADERTIAVAASSGGSFNLIHLDTMLKMDIFVARDPFHAIQLRRRLRQPITPAADSAIFVASPEDTVLAKLKWYKEGGKISDRQWSDVLGVLKVQARRLDQAYLKEWAKKLELTELLRLACDEAGLEFS